MDFEAVVAPFGVGNVAACVRDGTPRYIPGQPGKFAKLFSETIFWESIATGRKEGAAFPRAAFGSVQLPLALDVDSVRRALQSGNTVAVRNIDHAVDSLRRLSLDAEETLGFPGSASVHCYVSPPGTGYSFWHLDPATAVTCQIEGQKTWKYASTPAVPWSIRVGAYRGRELEWFGDQDWEPSPGSFPQPQAQECVETTLSAGDVLIMPPGVWHSVEAHQSTSISLNLRLQARPALDGVLDIVRRVCLAREHWRRPVAFAKRDEQRTGTPRQESLDELRTLLEDLNKTISEIASDDALLTNAWIGNFLGSQDLLEPQSAGAIDELDRLCIPANVRPRLAVAPDGQTSLLGNGRIMKFETPSIVKLLEELLHKREFTLGEVFEWPCTRRFDPVSVRKLIERLVVVGFLRRST